MKMARIYMSIGCVWVFVFQMMRTFKSEAPRTFGSRGFAFKCAID